MPPKPRPIIIERSEVPAYLGGILVGKFGENQSAFARHLGISRQAVFQLLNGDTTPSEEVMKKVGLRLAYIADLPDGGDEAPKAKGKREAHKK